MAVASFLGRLIRPSEVVMDFLTRIGMGEFTGRTRVAVYGNNPDIDPGTVPEDLWPGGGAYPWMTAANGLEVVSSSASDASSGTGARTIVIQGLDANYKAISAAVTLNGTSAVSISPQFFRINGASIATAGAGQTNAGTITIRDAGGGATRGIMPAGYGNLRQAVYTVPAGHRLVIYSTLIAINRTDTADRWATVASWVRTPNGVISMPAEIGFSSTTPYRDKYEVPASIPEKCDVALRVTQASGQNADITGNLMGFIVEVD